MLGAARRWSSWTLRVRRAQSRIRDFIFGRPATFARPSPRTVRRGSVGLLGLRIRAERAGGFSYVYPEKPGGGSDAGGERNGIPYQDLDIRTSLRVKPNGIDTDVRILNRWVDRARVRLAWALSADFADYDEVFGERRQEAAIVVEAAGTGVRFRYLHPQLPLETLVWVEGPGDWQYRDSKVAAELSLERQCEAHVRLRVRAIDREDPVSDVEAAAREERVRQWRGRVTPSKRRARLRSPVL